MNRNVLIDLRQGGGQTFDNEHIRNRFFFRWKLKREDMSKFVNTIKFESLMHTHRAR